MRQGNFPLPLHGKKMITLERKAAKIPFSIGQSHCSPIQVLLSSLQSKRTGKQEPRVVSLHTFLSNSPSSEHIRTSFTTHDAIKRLLLNDHILCAAIQNHVMNNISVVKDGLCCYDVIILVMWQQEGFAVICCLLSWHLSIKKRYRLEYR